MVHAGVELLKAVPLKNVTKYVMEYFIGINNSLSNKEAHDTLLAPQVQLSKTCKENAKFVHIIFAGPTRPSMNLIFFAGRWFDAEGPLLGLFILG